MKLVDIAKEPTLVKLTLDDEDTIKEFGEPLDFWVYDRQPMDAFMKFAGRGTDGNVMVEVVKALVLNEDGQPVIKDSSILPNKVMLRVVSKLMEHLGN
jgi:hypothetical protein